MAGLYGWQTGSVSYNVLENCYYITYDENAYHADGVVSATKNLYGSIAVDLTMTTEYVQKQEAFFGVQGFKGANAVDSFKNAMSDAENSLAMSATLKAMVNANM